MAKLTAPNGATVHVAAEKVERLLKRGYAVESLAPAKKAPAKRAASKKSSD